MSDAPHLFGPDEGEDISGRIRIKCVSEELVLTETVGSGSTEPHVHHDHADAFWVLEGKLTVLLADEEVVLEHGDFALTSPELVHRYVTDDARWLNLHAPSCGFEEWLRSSPPEFDQHEPPEDGGLPSSAGVVRRRGEGERIDLGQGTHGLVKAGADDGIGSFSLLEFELGPGEEGPPAHSHAGFTDSVYVLDGILTVLLGGEHHHAPAGSYAFFPPGQVHTISNPREEHVRFLNVTAPGGLERYLRELATDPSDFAAIAARHDVIPA